MSNARKSIIALSALALIGGAFLASASDAEARGRGGVGFSRGGGAVGVARTNKGFGNANGPILTKDNFGQIVPNFPGNGGIKPPPQHHHAGHNKFRVVVGGGFVGGGAAVTDGCVLEKRLVRGAPKFVKVCPTF